MTTNSSTPQMDAESWIKKMDALLNDTGDIDLISDHYFVIPFGGEGRTRMNDAIEKCTFWQETVLPKLNARFPGKTWEVSNAYDAHQLTRKE